MPKHRRRFTRKHTLLALAVLALLALAAVWLAPRLANAAFDPARLKPVDGWITITPEILVSVGTEGHVNPTLVVSEGEAILVDTGYRRPEGERIRDFIKQNNLTLRAVILTHAHQDHSANLTLFDRGSMKVYTPSNTQDGQEIRFGSRKLVILATPGHGAGGMHISVALPEERILIAGDLIDTGGLPGLGGSYLDFIASLEKVRAQNYALIIPGHGELTSGDRVIQREMDYLTGLQQHVTATIEAGGDLSDVLAIRPEDCLSDLSGMDPAVVSAVHQYNLGQMYAQMTLGTGKK